MEKTPNKTFDFVTAVKYLQEGKKVRALAEPEHFYYFLKPDTVNLKPLLYSSLGYAYGFSYGCFSWEWELYND